MRRQPGAADSSGAGVFGLSCKTPRAIEEGPPLLLSLQPESRGLREAAGTGNQAASITFLSGPEGGLSRAEEEAALANGFVPVTLGPRVLRAKPPL